MKKLLVFLFVGIMSIMTTSAQISGWRSSPPTRNSMPSFSQGQQNFSGWRNNPPINPRQSFQTQRPNYNWNNNSYYNYNRWNMWGAPMFGYNYYSPWYYYNNWGYREPARIYVYPNGKQDTIRGKSVHFSFGIQKDDIKQIGGWATIGNRNYFIGEYSQTYAKDNSTFYPFGRLSLVDFPLVDDLKLTQTFYIGLGKKIKRTGIHFMVGSINETVRYRGKDSISYLTFPKQNNSRMTVKAGLIHDFQNLSIKLDYDPILKSTTYGVGVNF
jgi:hypothetical protein